MSSLDYGIMTFKDPRHQTLAFYYHAEDRYSVQRYVIEIEVR
jgi:YD repeat-containing protein